MTAPPTDAQVRKLAAKRGSRFGLELSRMTVDVDTRRRRRSFDLRETEGLARRGRHCRFDSNDSNISV
jgi:hypothetical protein